MLADLQDECPDTWKDSKMDFPAGEAWLNATIAFSDCSGGEKPAANAHSAIVSASTAASAAASAQSTSTASPTTKIELFTAALTMAMLMMML